MSQITDNLKLAYMAQGQAQKHVTYNGAIRQLDALIQLSVASRAVASPPGAPADGARYLVAAGAMDGWAGQAGQVAAFQDGAWAFFTPKNGWRCYVEDEGALLVFDGTGWAAIGGSGGDSGGGVDDPLQLTGLGVRTGADAVNALAVKSDAVLFSHDDVTPGSGDMRTTLNKAGAGNTASLVFQSGFSGRAEMGLAGADDWSIKVSADGANWRDGLVIEAASGAVTLPVVAQLSTQRSGRDGFGVFTMVERRRSNGSLAERSQLLGGTAPYYATRRLSLYEGDGVTLRAQFEFALSFDQAEFVGETLV